MHASTAGEARAANATMPYLLLPAGGKASECGKTSSTDGGAQEKKKKTRAYAHTDKRDVIATQAEEAEGF